MWLITGILHMYAIYVYTYICCMMLDWEGVLEFLHFATIHPFIMSGSRGSALTI